MFTAFKSGNEAGDQGWDDSPTSYAPGRFHAHPRGPAAPASRATAAQNPTARPQRRGVTRRPQQYLDESPEEDSNERSWLLRPGRDRVESWLEAWWKRWAVLVGIPCVVVWLWVGTPFPTKDPWVEEPPWNLPWPGDGTTTSSAPTATGDWTATRGASPAFAAATGQAFAAPVPGPLRRRWQMLEILPNPLLGKATQIPSRTRAIAALPTRRSRVDWDGDEGEDTDDPEILPVDANWYFFLFFYYGIYLAWALIFVTKLFDLYRLNWWPTTLGGTVSYFVFWALPLFVGYLLHYFELDGFGTRRGDAKPGDRARSNYDWERKTTWVVLAFTTMLLPAVVCFSKLRADRRQTFRRSLTPAQKTFLERQLASRMPRSYKRFLWFMLTFTLSLIALILGQGFATIYLSTLPHSNLDGVVYVYSWILTIQCLNGISNWILQNKVRSRALVFVFRFYFFLVYHVFYRNLFARLRSPDQALYIQLLSSSWVILWYPVSMSRTFHRVLRWAIGYDKPWEDYAENIGTMLYLRNLSENVTMVAFLGWLTILHYGPNKPIYPFFSFDSDTDPYNYRLTAIASLIIWATELVSSFLARVVIWYCYKLDVTNIGLDHFREHPELVVACVWCSIHVLSDILLFLVRLNFR